MFTAYPTYNPYRSLYDRTEDGLPLLSGEDVFGLQCALNAIVRAGLVLDGVLGPKTGAQIWVLQAALSLEQDGVAGSVTQRAIDLFLLTRAGASKGTKLYKLGKGAFERESLYIIGNYSPPRDNNTFDAGVVQRNSQFHSLEASFDPVGSIEAWLEHTRKAFALYADTSKFRDTGYTYSDAKRRYKLAGGAWNAPYIANYYAGITPAVTPSAEGAAAFLDYVEGVGVYL